MPVIIILVLILDLFLYGQNKFKAVVREHDGKPLAGVNILITNTSFGTATDTSGLAVIENVPSGIYKIMFSFIGYKEEFISVSFPADDGKLFEIVMEMEAEEMEEVSVSSTRSSRLISNEPTRVEVIAGEEIDEKLSMDPSNISMMLNESTGIQVQQTSASSAINTFRIQGLEGRYTQLLKDGLPLYSGFSGSLSIVQVPPLDLKQVEIIKGSSSTLFGGGAIAGLINLISKEPEKDKNLSFLVNGTSAGGIDLSGFYSARSEKTGLTLLASGNTQPAYDNNDDNFSDLPEIERYSLSPKFFFYFGENVLELGGTFINEERTGGAIPRITGNSDSFYSYLETNQSTRFASSVKYSYSFSENDNIVLKNSIGYFHRDLSIPSYTFSGRQIMSFTEAVFTSAVENSDWVLGLNLLTDDFRDRSNTALPRDYSELTAGIFSQLTFNFSEEHSAEAGLRIDYAKDHNFFPLPRISFLSKWNKNLTTRIGGGLGYKLPTVFTEKSEEIFFKNVLPIDRDKVKPEKSFGINFDVNFSALIFSSVTLSFNNLFFYTRINDPLILVQKINTDAFEFNSFDGHYDTRGAESNLKITYGALKLFTGYAFTFVESHGSIKKEFPLTPKHRLGFILVFEEHENYRIGLEAYYTGKQKLSDGSIAADYWVNGLMIEKHFENVSFFLNFENFLDTRQSRYGRMFSGSPSNPLFAEIYAPTEGRIINGGAKIRF